MRSTVLACAALLLTAAPAGLDGAHAQNPAQIATVRAGRSCPGCNLFQADLSRARLGALDLHGARMRQASFSAAVVAGANLSGADLRDVDAYGALFTRVRFRGADLSKAVLVGAVFGGADLSGAKLDGANLSGAELQHARGLTQRQLNLACGDENSLLPQGLHIGRCR